MKGRKKDEKTPKNRKKKIVKSGRKKLEKGRIKKGNVGLVEKERWKVKKLWKERKIMVTDAT